jgi:YgiT-type zinc finger domain-containing protein
MMTCPVCRQAETIDDVTLVFLERGEMQLEIKNVPARVCPHCGEAYVDEITVAHLLQRAEQTFPSGDRHILQENYSG